MDRGGADRGGPALADLLLEAAAAIPAPSESQLRLLRQIGALGGRLAAGRLHVAALGQFKRGKSTLLNALLGADLLPSAVVPLTAIPTFLRAGPALHLCVTHVSGAVRDIPVGTTAELDAHLHALVTERGNPENARGIARVEVCAPAAILAQGVVLIDTPGIGSTLRHNTATAEALLPECDAGLFVVSPDPPITEAEIAYLARVRAHAGRIVVVLNKIDAVEAPDRPEALAFLRRVLEQAGLGAAPVFCVSARAAVRARAAGDMAALDASGLPALADHLGAVLASEKQDLLHRAISRKAAALVADLAFDMRITIRSLRLPAEDLERRLAAFGQMKPRFEEARRAAHDLLAGDRSRTAALLEAAMQQLAADARTALQTTLDRALAEGSDAGQARAVLAADAQTFFAARLDQLDGAVRAWIAEGLSIHQRRGDDLIGDVRRTAAELLDIPFAAPVAEDAFTGHHQSHWAASGRTETAMPFTSGTFDRLLPAALRRRRLAGRLMSEAAILVTRNVENLRWTILRNLDDAFRRFGSELDARLAAALHATHGAMQAGMNQRRRFGERLGPKIDGREHVLRRLGDIEAALLRLAESPGGR